MVTAEQLRERFLYDPRTGLFTRRKYPGDKRPVGMIKGGRGGGYRTINIRGKAYRAARLAWLYVNGAWPVGTVDHVNGDRADDRFANLRQATMSQNGANRKVQSNSKSGIKGVCWHKRLKKWHAQLRFRGKQHKIGFFDDLEAAKAAYDSKAREIFGEFARS